MLRREASVAVGFIGPYRCAQLLSDTVPEQCQLLSIGIFSLYHAGYERKDFGERECKQATLPLRKTMWGNPQKLEGIKNTAARVVFRAHGKEVGITRVCEKHREHVVLA